MAFLLIWNFRRNYCEISACSNDILMGGEGNYCGISASANDILKGVKVMIVASQLVLMIASWE